MGMFGGFALCLPVVDMLVLLLATCRLFRSPAQSGSAMIAVSRVMRKLAMLDVAVVGMAVVVLSLQSFRDKGVILSLRWGMLALVGAVVCHYLMAFLVGRAHQRIPVDEASLSRPKLEVDV